MRENPDQKDIRVGLYFAARDPITPEAAARALEAPVQLVNQVIKRLAKGGLIVNVGTVIEDGEPRLTFRRTPKWVGK